MAIESTVVPEHPMDSVHSAQPFYSGCPAVHAREFGKNLGRRSATSRTRAAVALFHCVKLESQGLVWRPATHANAAWADHPMPQPTAECAYVEASDLENAVDGVLNSQAASAKENAPKIALQTAENTSADHDRGVQRSLQRAVQTNRSQTERIKTSCGSGIKGRKKVI